MIWIILIGLLVRFFFIRAILDKNTHQKIKIENSNHYFEAKEKIRFEAEEKCRKTNEYDEEILDYKNRYQVKKSEAAYQLGLKYFLDSEGFVA